MSTTDVALKIINKVDVIYFWVCAQCQHEIYKRLADRRAVNHIKIKRTERYSEM